MSRGLARVERRILELLEGVDSLQTAKIAWWIAGQAEPTPAVAASVQRAVIGLEKRGRVVRITGRAWMLEEKWRRWENQRKRDEATERETAERERIAKDNARQKADAERHARADAERHAREDAERRAREDAERRAREDAEARAREEACREPTAERASHRESDIATDSARLVKVLGLLASAHDGEVLSAARQAEQIRRRMGCRWDELIIMHNLFGKAAIPADTRVEPYVCRDQDEVDSAIDAFHRAMSDSSFGNRP